MLFYVAMMKTGKKLILTAILGLGLTGCANNRLIVYNEDEFSYAASNKVAFLAQQIKYGAVSYESPDNKLQTIKNDKYSASIVDDSENRIFVVYTNDTTKPIECYMINPETMQLDSITQITGFSGITYRIDSLNKEKSNKIKSDFEQAVNSFFK